MKYKEWLDIWLIEYQKTYLKERTYRNYEGVIKNHILPALGEYELEELTISVLQGFVIERETNAMGRYGVGLSSGSVSIIINVLQKSLDMAVNMGIVDNHSADRITRPKAAKKKQTDCFTLAEQRKIEDAIIKELPHKKIGILITLYTGLRIGELMALRWEDVDFDRKTITVKHTMRYDYVDGTRSAVLDTPKTLSSQRIIPIPNSLLPYLIMTRSVSAGEYVIESCARETNIRSYQKLYAHMLKSLNIRYRSFHTLRHTFATRALESGMDVKTLSEIMGHKSATMTLDRYSHSMMEHKIAMMNRIGNNVNRKHRA